MPDPRRPESDAPVDPADLDMWQRLAALPDLDDAPVEDARLRRRLEAAPAARRDASESQPTGTRGAPAGTPVPSGEPRRYYVPAPDPSVAPPQPSPAVPPEIEPRPEPLPRPRPTGPAPPRRRRARRWPWWVAGAAVLVLVAIVGMLLYANWLWGRIERVDVTAALAGGGRGTNYLIVGTDSREGIDPDNPNAPVIIGEPVAGERADTVMVLHLGPDGNRMLSLNRDLWVTIAGTGREERINTALTVGGPATLIRTVQENFGIPLDHYMEVDLAGFLDLVEAVGGITIHFEHPAFDRNSGLNVTETGPVHLDADQALAFVRSRTYTEVIDGREVVDPTADLGRVQRQQEFLRAVFSEVGATRNPVRTTRVLRAMTNAIVIDDDMSFWHAMSLARKLGGLDPETVSLPVFGFTTSGGASVLGVDAAAAEPILERFR